jgi:hypothetical protein
LSLDAVLDFKVDITACIEAVAAFGGVGRKTYE